MSTTEKPKQRPVARAPVSTGPSSGSPEKTGLSNRRLAVVAGLLTTAIVVAVVLLFSIGAPGGEEQTVNPNVESRVEFDPGPPWQPNQSALEQVLNSSPTTDGIDPADRKFHGQSNPTTDLETDFAGNSAPKWQPNLATTSTNPTIDPETGFAGISAPQWEPNYGRLGTYLGTEQVAGIR